MAQINPAASTQLQAQSLTSSSEGIHRQQQRLQSNVAEIAQRSTEPSSTGSLDEALLAQHEIVRAVEANARAFETANQVIGTILDVKI